MSHQSFLGEGFNYMLIFSLCPLSPNMFLLVQCVCLLACPLPYNRAVSGVAEEASEHSAWGHCSSWGHQIKICPFSINFFYLLVSHTCMEDTLSSFPYLCKFLFVFLFCFMFWGFWKRLILWPQLHLVSSLAGSLAAPCLIILFYCPSGKRKKKNVFLKCRTISFFLGLPHTLFRPSFIHAMTC